MNLFLEIKNKIVKTISEIYPGTYNIDITLNTDRDQSFGDLSCNAALILAKELKRKPRDIAEEIKNQLKLSEIDKVEIAEPGFLNITLNKNCWKNISKQIHTFGAKFYAYDGSKEKIIVEFVSANPTGPLHLGHGRNGIIGDVLAKVLKFLGHDVTAEFYINDAGNQMDNLGLSLKERCKEALGQEYSLPDNGYHGEYLIKIAQQLVKQKGDVLEESTQFFTNYAKEKLLQKIKDTLSQYKIHFNSWFSEKTLHVDGSIDSAIDLLKSKRLVYEQDGALWFKATEFGDDKDRVIKKQDGALTYIAADIAYHKNKFDRGFTKLIDIMGQDHHGYVKRLKATMAALGYNEDNLQVILYQLVSIKMGDTAMKMSKRAGTFTTLEEIIETVGTDVARFFYLNRKAEAHLEFDLETALKKTEENPAYYVQYAYVRTGSVLSKASNISSNIDDLNLSDDDIKILKKIVELQSILIAIGNTNQTHLLTYYAIELSKAFHSYYANNRIIDTENIETTKSRLMMTKLIRETLGTCLDLLGITKPEKM